jgi:uncharacterized protein (DUF1015 family)
MNPLQTEVVLNRKKNCGADLMEIRPFRALRFDEGIVGNAGGCIAPPYDIIGSAQQESLYKKNEYNIVRITKGKTAPSDNENNNQYTRAAEFFKVWMEKGVLKQDAAETIYVYVQDFEMGGVQRRRLSFIALSRLEEFGKIVRPHEKTLDEPKIDRLKLLRATAANFGLVFMLYEDKEKIADKIIEKAAAQKPLIDFLDEQNVRHQIFAITDKKDIETIAKMMQRKSCIIADGHHRYETGLTYYKETKNPAAAYQMTAFTNICDEGLVCLATHRLVGGLENFDFEKLIAEMKQDFEITQYRFDSAAGKTKAGEKMLAEMKNEHNNGKNAFGIYGRNGAFYAAVLKNKKAMDSAAPDMSRCWRLLDVSVIQKLIFEKILGIDEKLVAGKNNIEYVKDMPDAINESIAKVDRGDVQAAFFMNPVTMEQLKKVTEAGEKMPQKSTYFYPKVFTGLTINKF